MAKGFRSRLSWLIVPASLVCLALAASYVLGQQVNRNREIEIELGAEVKDPVTELFDEAQHLRTHGKEAEALAAFEQILVKHPDAPIKPMVYFYMGSCLRDLGRLDDAIACYRRLTSDLPEHEDTPMMLLNLGLTYEHAERYPEAMDVYQNVRQRWPNTGIAAQATVLRACYFQRVQDYGQAISEYAAVLSNRQLDSKLWKSRAMTGMAMVYLQQERYDDAIELIQQQIQEYGASSQKQAMLVDAYHLSDRHSDATEAGLGLLAEYPGYHNAHAVRELLEERGPDRRPSRQ